MVPHSQQSRLITPITKVKMGVLFVVNGDCSTITGEYHPVGIGNNDHRPYKAGIPRFALYYYILYIILYYIILYCTILYYIILLHYIILYYIILYYIILYIYITNNVFILFILVLLILLFLLYVEYTVT